MNTEEKKLAYRILFGKWLEKSRNEKRMSQEEVANRIGVSRSVISYYESGKRSINLNEAIYLCESCGFDFGELASLIAQSSDEDLEKVL